MFFAQTRPKGRCLAIMHICVVKTKHSISPPTVKPGVGEVMTWVCFAMKGLGFIAAIVSSMKSSVHQSFLVSDMILGQDNAARQWSQALAEMAKKKKTGIKVLQWCNQVQTPTHCGGTRRDLKVLQVFLLKVVLQATESRDELFSLLLHLGSGYC